MKTSNGVIYVLTNPSFPEYVKIGYADDLIKRLNQLNKSDCLPFAFRAYCTYEVDGRLKDKDVHRLIDKLNPELRSIETFNGKPRIREFYNMSAEDAYEILSSIAEISNTASKLHKLSPEGHEIQDEKIANEIQSSGAVAYTEDDHFTHSSESNIRLYKLLKEKIMNLGEISIEPKKLYIAFKSGSNICDIELQRSKLKIFINIPKGKLEDPEGLAEDVSQKGHWGNGDYQFLLDDERMIDIAMAFINQSYNFHKIQ